MREVFGIKSELLDNGTRHITFSDGSVEVFRNGEFVEKRPPENAHPISRVLIKVFGLVGGSGTRLSRVDSL